MVADDAENLLKVGSVGGAYAQNAVCFARYRVRLDYFGNVDDHLTHSVRRHPALRQAISRQRPENRTLECSPGV